MGTFTERVGVSNGNGGATQWVEVLIDTGATYTVLPDSLLRESVGVRPRRQEDFTLGDGRKVRLPIGVAWFHVGDREAASTVVFGPDDRYLLGATALQELGLIPDTTHHRLIRAPEFLI